MADDLTGGAPAPAETIAAPEVQSNTPEPIVESTPRGAIDRAFATLESNGGDKSADRPATKAEPEAAKLAPAAEGERPRNPDGTFAAKDPAPTTQPAQETAKPDTATLQPPKADAPAGEAPARFAGDPEAKAAWAATPEPVKAATQRIIREMEQGIEKYRGDATVYNDTFKPFVDLAVQSRLDPKVTLQNYVNIDMLLTKDFEAGITQIFQNKGMNPREWAAKIMGQPAPTPQPQDQIINDLRQQITRLEQGFQGVHQTIEQQRAAGISQSLEGFMGSLPEADKTLFNELDAEIAAYLRDPATTLADAFAKAKADAHSRYTRMFGAQTPAPARVPAAAAQTREPNLEAQTLKGSLSVSGAPGAGSDPGSRKTPSSPRAAIDDAFASLGL